jgi:hypothetical protein
MRGHRSSSTISGNHVLRVSPDGSGPGQRVSRAGLATMRDLAVYFFNPEVQFNTTVIGEVLAAASSLTVLSRNRPSAATS